MPAEPLDEFNPILQELRDRFERKYLGDEGLEFCEPDAIRAYNRSWKRPYVCVLVSDILSGRWEMGETQEAVSGSLGIRDRTWLSVALRQGELTLDNYMRLRCWPGRPPDWEPDVALLASDMHRSGFIAVARYFAGFVKDRPTMAPQRLDELNYELLCEVLSVFNGWASAFFRKDAGFASDIVRRVSQDQNRNVAPSWLKRSDREAVLDEVRRLSSNTTAALTHLCQLQNDWQDVFAVTHALVGSMRWRQR